MVRLDHLLGETLGIKKRAAADIVRAGEIAIAGVVTREPHYQVVLGEAADVSLRGGPLLTPERRRPFAHRLFLMHKPQNCQSERLKPGDARLSVYDVVARAGIDLPSSSLGCFGRLDANTTGLLLMGTDGGLQSLLMHPSSGCEKAYVATLRVLPAARLRATAADEFARGGMRLADGHVCAPAGLEVLETVDAGDGGAPFPRRVRVTLREGQYHQVKRMLGACGASVDALCRERIGGLSLADLPALAAEGSVVEATERELQLLRSMLRAPAAPARIESTAASHAA